MRALWDPSLIWYDGDDPYRKWISKRTYEFSAWPLHGECNSLLALAKDLGLPLVKLTKSSVIAKLLIVLCPEALNIHAVTTFIASTERMPMGVCSSEHDVCEHRLSSFIESALRRRYSGTATQPVLSADEINGWEAAWARLGACAPRWLKDEA